ncbi:hypothetical protein Ahu01nite_055880 [Winogradskya humida]|uniref:VWFA domain-containing protein n=1 Tax=Winogradskya humida TaxID=113566 RepID=A0ABQ3ZV58_9ACTN|nr:hypothetical protein Ahu01nite_055880 [Actinoplanes humidus]
MGGVMAGVDRAAFAVGLVERLRGAGVRGGLTGAGDLVRALEVAVPRDRGELYWVARVTLVRREGDLGVFDRVFAGVFEEAAALVGPRGEMGGGGGAFVSVPAGSGVPDGGGLPWATRPAVVADAAVGGEGVAVPRVRASALVGLADRPFEELDADHVALLGEWLRSVTWPVRRSRRREYGVTGRGISVRATLGRARRTGWEPIVLVRARKVLRARRIVLVCDVSRSMQAQAEAYLHLLRAFAAVTEAEVFAFGTSLTRLTVTLRGTDPRAAVARAGELVTDRFGGTRIAGSLRSLLASHHGDLVRGSVLVIGSDGWDSDPPGELGAVMARLARRAHRTVWLNPRAGADAFAPVTGGMAAALPFCDRLLPAATFADLATAIPEIVTSRISRRL